GLVDAFAALKRARQAPAVESGDPTVTQVETSTGTTVVVETQPVEADSAVMAKVINLYTQQFTAEGDQAAREGQYDVALRKYEEALNLNAEYEPALKGREAVRAVLDRRGAVPQGGLMNDFLRNHRVLEDRTKVEFRETLQQADDALAAGNFVQASDAVSSAISILDHNREYLRENEYLILRQAALDMGVIIRREEEKERVQELLNTNERVEKESKERKESALAEQQRKVQQLLQRAWALQREMQYHEALSVLDQLLFIDRHNIPGQAMKDIIEDIILIRRTRSLEETRTDLINEHSVEHTAATLPMVDIVTWPADWPEITKRRLGALGQAGIDTIQDRNAYLELQKPISVNFQEDTFKSVVEYLQNLTQVNFFPTWPALEVLNIDQETWVTLKTVQPIPASTVLDHVLAFLSGDLGEFEGLGWIVQDGAVIISTLEQLARRTVTQTYDIRDLLVEVKDFTEVAQSFDLGELAGQDTTGGGSGGADVFGDFGDDDDTGAAVGGQIGRISQLIIETVDPESWDLTSHLSPWGSEAIIITTTRDNHREIDGLLDQLRALGQIQISVESRFLFIDQAFLEEVLADVDLAVNVPGGSFGPITVAQNHANLAAQAGNTGMTSGFSPTSLGGGLLVDPVRAANSALPGARSLLFQTSFLSDIEVDLMIQATQTHRRSVELTAPRITFVNGQVAVMSVVTQRAFVSDLTVVTGTGVAAFDPEISVISEGVQLLVEGTVTADRRYVNMRIEPSLGKVVAFREFEQSAVVTRTVSDGLGGTTDSDAIVTGRVELPLFDVTTLGTNVIVPDRGTLMVGGQRIVSENEIEAGVPVLSKIPVINRLFTNRSNEKSERTLLVLVKPTIIIQQEEEDRLYPGLLQDPAAFTSQSRYIGHGF
ncbi:MAG: hypothetical protein CMJ49_06360, partial [Planctomycetaceae bacterium]|nr:hypothetical protein [Planctomycetaceae bacterium]